MPWRCRPDACSPTSLAHTWNPDARDVEQAIAHRLVDAGIPSLLRAMISAHKERAARAYEALKSHFKPAASLPSPLLAAAKPRFVQATEAPGYLPAIRPMVNAAAMASGAVGDDALEQAASRARTLRNPAPVPAQGSPAL